MALPIFTVILSEGADADLDDLHRYIAETRSLDEADALLDRLLARAATLTSFPLKGSIPKELEALGVHDFRQIVLPPYRLIYRVINTSVYITVIADSRRDMATLFQHRLLGR